MKRISTLILAMAFVLGSVCGAQAIDLKVKGQWDFAFGWVDNKKLVNKDDDKGNDPFYATQRVRTQINFIASEQLQGVLMFEIGNLDWGRANGKGRQGGADLDADGVNVETKRAYLDWMIPDTDVSIRMGIQGLMLPSGTGLGNPVLNSDVAGITVNAPINDMFGITALWVRPFDAQENDGNTGNLQDEMDLFALMLPITGEGWNVTPWAAYASMGTASGAYDYILNYQNTFATGVTGGDDHSDVWWAGVAVSVEVFDPLTFGFDVFYGDASKADLTMTRNGITNSGAVGSSGWFVDANLNYKLDWATPGIFGWYSTGDDKDDVEDGDYGRVPAIGFDSGFAPTTFGAPGSFSIGADSIVSTTMIGTWGVGAQIADMSFVDKLSHTLRVTYYRGTNDHEVAENDMHAPLSGENIYMTDKDSGVEVNFDHQYQMYDNLKVALELSYIHLWMDEDVWNNVDNFNGSSDDPDDAWKATLYFQYKF